MHESEANNEGNAPEADEDVILPERPGRRLAEARERMGWSLSQVAEEMRLNVRLVTALEQDDDDALPPPAYVTGYLRSYSRLLKLPEEEVINAYELHHPEKETPEIRPQVKDNQASSQDLPVRAMTWIVIIGLLVMSALWWFSQNQHLPTMAEVESETTLAIAEPTSPAQPEPMMEERLPELETAPAESPIGEEAASPETVEQTEQASTAEPEVTPAVADNTQDSAALSEQAAVQAESAPVESREPEIPPLSDNVPRSELRMSFAADSWVEVTDAEGRKLAYDLVGEGRTRILEGEAPFRIFLGYAPGVEIIYNGEPFDHTPFHRQDLARFRIGRESDNRLPTE